MVIGTAGHIDHGKSALVHALTGTHPDRLAVERQRGITIELGFAHFTHDDVTVSMVDVPGHERFVRHMLAGAGGIGAVLLVVSATESVKPQTREHVEICQLLGLSRGLVALTKTDLVDDETVDLVAMEVRDLLAGTPLRDLAMYHVSSVTGAGVAAVRDALVALARETPAVSTPRPMRLPVDRAFSRKGFGTVVTGTLVAGRLAVGDAVVAAPKGHRTRVRGLHVHGRPVANVEAPERVAVNLDAVSVADVSRGTTLLSLDAAPATRIVDAVLQMLPGRRALAHGARVRLHQGTQEILARVRVVATRPATTAPWVAPRPSDIEVVVPPGGAAFARLIADAPMALTRHDRLVMRTLSPATTIAGAVVLDPAPPRLRLRRADTLQRFVRLLDDAPALDVWIDDAGTKGMAVSDLACRSGRTCDEIATALEAAVGEGRVHLVDGRAFGPEWRPVEAPVPKPSAAGVDHDVELLTVVESLVRAGGLTPPDLASLAHTTGVSVDRASRGLALLVHRKTLVRVGGIAFHAQTLAELRTSLTDYAKHAGGAEMRLDVGTFKARFGVSRKFAIPLLEWLDSQRVTRREGTNERIYVGDRSRPPT